MSAWAGGKLRPGFLCPFCAGRGAFFRLKAERYDWWRCMACKGTGATEVQPAEMRIGAAQGKYLKQYPDTRAETNQREDARG